MVILLGLGIQKNPINNTFGFWRFGRRHRSRWTGEATALPPIFCLQLSKTDTLLIISVYLMFIIFLAVFNIIYLLICVRQQIQDAL